MPASFVPAVISLMSQYLGSVFKNIVKRADIVIRRRPDLRRLVFGLPVVDRTGAHAGTGAGLYARRNILEHHAACRVGIQPAGRFLVDKGIRFPAAHILTRENLTEIRPYAVSVQGGAGEQP